jgi:gluconate kinase
LVVLQCPPGAEQAPISHGEVGYRAYLADHRGPASPRLVGANSALTCSETCLLCQCRQTASGCRFLNGDKQVIDARIVQREHRPMPPALLCSQLETPEEPGEDEHPAVVSLNSSVAEQ